MKIKIENATERELSAWLAIFIRMKFVPELRHELLGQKDLHAFIDLITREYVELKGEEALEDWCFRADLDVESKFCIAHVLADMKAYHGSVDLETVTELVKPVILHRQVKKEILKVSEQREKWEALRDAEEGRAPKEH